MSRRYAKVPGIANPAFDAPTTIAGSGVSGLFVVNARFGIVVTPDTPYNVVRFSVAPGAVGASMPAQG